jgi:hypothetical protein
MEIKIQIGPAENPMVLVAVNEENGWHWFFTILVILGITALVFV